jgi:hypothetical protein
MARAFKSGRCNAFFPEPEVARFSARVFSIWKYTQEKLVEKMDITYQSSACIQVGGSEIKRLEKHEIQIETERNRVSYSFKVF